MSLDAIRGIAALIVCLGHWRYIYFVDFHTLTAHKAFWFLPYLITRSGHQAVIIFFVLSGFLVGGAVLRAFDQRVWNWKQYLTHRFVRLWLVLLPALMLGILWDRLSLFLEIHHSGYSGSVVEHILPPHSIAASLTFATFLGNFLFLQSILVPVLGTNGPLWSLSYEFWYYLLFPFAFFALRRHYKTFSRLLCAAAFTFSAWFIGRYIMMYFAIWLAGVLLHFIPRRNIPISGRVVSTILYVIAFLGCVDISRTHFWFSDYLLCIFTTVYLWVLLSATQRSAKGAFERLARSTAGFSYTLYLVHLPFLYFLSGFLIHDQRWPLTLTNLSIAFAVLAVVIFYAWLISRITEARLIPVRRWVEARLSRTSGRRPIIDS